MRLPRCALGYRHPWIPGRPVVVPDDEKAVRGLTTLGEGEHWVLKPRYLGDGLWTPGIRAGVVPGSEFHLTEYFAPVLGVMRVDTLEEAIEAVNQVDYGLTSGLQTLDTDELAAWLEGIEAGNLYVNRGITGAIGASSALRRMEAFCDRFDHEGWWSLVPVGLG